MRPNAKLFPAGSLLIGMYDTAALKMSITDRVAAFNQAIAGAKPNVQINLNFILHAIAVRRAEFLEMRRGVRQRNLSLGKIKSLIIRVSELNEQRETVRQLQGVSSATSRLEGNYQKKLADLAQLKQSILQKAFSGEVTAVDQVAQDAISA